MRVYSREFRMQIVRRILEGEKVPALSRELGIHRKVLYEWMRRVNDGGEHNLRQRGRPRKSETIARAAASAAREIAELQQMIARQQRVIGFLQICLAGSRDVPAGTPGSWRGRIFQAIEKTTQGDEGLSVETMCELAGVPRSGYYRYLRARIPGRR